MSSLILYYSLYGVRLVATLAQTPKASLFSSAIWILDLVEQDKFARALRWHVVVAAVERLHEPACCQPRDKRDVHGTLGDVGKPHQPLAGHRLGQGCVELHRPAFTGAGAGRNAE